KAPPSSRFLHVCDRDGSVKSLPLCFRLPADFADGDHLTPEDAPKIESSGPIPNALFLLPDGLLLGAGYQSSRSIAGFWKIPFTDIEALLAVTPASSPTQPAAP